MHLFRIAAPVCIALAVAMPLQTASADLVMLHLYENGERITDNQIFIDHSWITKQPPKLCADGCCLLRPGEYRAQQSLRFLRAPLDNVFTYEEAKDHFMLSQGEGCQQAAFYDGYEYFEKITQLQKKLKQKQTSDIPSDQIYKHIDFDEYLESHGVQYPIVEEYCKPYPESEYSSYLQPYLDFSSTILQTSIPPAKEIGAGVEDLVIPAVQLEYKKMIRGNMSFLGVDVETGEIWDSTALYRPLAQQLINQRMELVERKIADTDFIRELCHYEPEPLHPAAPDEGTSEQAVAPVGSPLSPLHIFLIALAMAGLFTGTSYMIAVNTSKARH